MLVRSIIVILLFALIGLIWGRLRPVKANIVYLDLVSSYRNNILDQVKREQEVSLSPDYENLNKNNGKEAEPLPSSNPVLLPRDSILPQVSPPKEQQKDIQEPKEGVFGRFIHWIKKLFINSDREKEREQIREEASLVEPQPVSHGESLSKEKEMPPKISPQKEEAVKDKNHPQSSMSDKEQQDLLKDTDISKFLLNTDVVPEEKK